MSRRARGSSGERASALTEAREVGTGPHRTTVARDAEAVYFWSSGSRLPDQVYRWGGAVGALAAAERASETVVLAADGRRMWMWSWKSGLPRHGGPLTDIRRMNVDRLAALSIGSRLFVLAAGNRAELYEVHPAATGADRILRERSDLGALDAPARAAAAYAAPVPSPVAHGPSAGRARDEARQGWIAVADGRRIRVWCCETDPAAPLAPPTVRLVRELESPARGLVFGRHDAELLIAGYEEVTVRVWAVGGARREAAFQLDAPRDGAMAFEPHGRGLLAVADGPDIRMLDVASALNTGHGTRRRPSNQRPEVALAEAPHGPPLLCRTWGDRVLVSRPVPGAAAATPVTTLTHQGLVTAVAAVHTAGGWAVVAAAERTVRMWRLSEDDLSAEGRTTSGSEGTPGSGCRPSGSSSTPPRRGSGSACRTEGASSTRTRRPTAPAAGATGNRRGWGCSAAASTPESCGTGRTGWPPTSVTDCACGSTARSAVRRSIRSPPCARPI